MNRAKKICCHPGCRTLTNGEPRCTKHTAQHAKRPSIMRSGDPFYRSPAWRRLRAQKVELNPLCEECLAMGRVTPAAEVHHIKPRVDYPELALEITNTASLCKSHHSAHTMREQRARRQ